ncbi:unnamed protein product (macronuclear) [Paramecium tetraurelia]|uniref:Uncharacterized protein n=1 Tax=Paramecium tetraurelia TaxID=5888 RepID=A0C8Y8_PARTE|nr:uncharacterized protein GSPATT00036391001 [Paramecium tetraurelia]CAK67255.1 unnamed protein product [Paramecium tetraurelia]|eukprot:XP_001434652.1 hypothetical protein (macronuclear) [Paramecium tetraurelia strain d4-2]
MIEIQQQPFLDQFKIRVNQKYFKQNRLQYLIFSFNKVVEQLIQELQRAGEWYLYYKNDIFSSQSPALSIPIVILYCIFEMEWLSYSGQYEEKFIDQLKEAYEIELDSQLVNQVNWRVTLDKVFSEDNEQRSEIRNTLENILIDQMNPTSSFKVLKQKKEILKQVLFINTKQMESETQQQKIKSTQILGFSLIQIITVSSRW